MFRYKRLSFGINAAAEMFQDVIASAISEIPSGKKVSDDVIIYGVNRKEHKTLYAVLTRDKKLNLSLRKDINFFGLVFSGRGMSPDPAKIEATQQIHFLL